MDGQRLQCTAPGCHEFYSSIDQLDIHFRRHGVKTNPCPQCLLHAEEKRFDKYFSLREHYRNVHGSKLGSRDDPLLADRLGNCLTSTRGGFTYFGARHKSALDYCNGLQAQDIGRAEGDAVQVSGEADRADDEDNGDDDSDGHQEHYGAADDNEKKIDDDTSAWLHTLPESCGKSTFTAGDRMHAQEASEAWGNLSYTRVGSAETAPWQRSIAVEPISGASPSQQQASLCVDPEFAPHTYVPEAVLPKELTPY